MKAQKVDLALQLIKLGDEAAFEQVYHAYYNRLCSFAYAIIHNNEYAEEVVDDVMLNTWNKRTNIEVTSLWPYLVKAVRNNSIKLVQSKDFRHTNLLTSLSDEGQKLWQYISEPDTPIGSMIERELEDQVQEIIQSFSDECREVFLLGRDKGLSYQQIADRVGISKNTVKYHLKRALQEFHARLSPMLFLLLIARWFLH